MSLVSARAVPAQPGRWSPRRLGRTLLQPVVARTGIVMLLLVLWELGARWGGDSLFIAPPSKALVALWGLFGDSGVMAAVGLVLWELLVAFVLSISLGLAIGLGVGLNRFCRNAIYPIILMLYACPLAPLLPLFVLLFGIGPASKIAFGFSHGIFPIIVTVASSVQNSDPSLTKAARSMGANGRQRLWNIVFPLIMPAFFTGTRLAMTGVLFGVLLAELFVSSAGVGFYTSQFTNSFQPQKLFALIAILTAIAVTLNGICRRAEAHFSRWRA
jgi:ABC-type nitrate/sulfonate/bicarbonate transport system permease component